METNLNLELFSCLHFRSLRNLLFSLNSRNRCLFSQLHLFFPQEYIVHLVHSSMHKVISLQRKSGKTCALLGCFTPLVFIWVSTFLHSSWPGFTEDKHNRKSRLLMGQTYQKSRWIKKGLNLYLKLHSYSNASPFSQDISYYSKLW